MTDYVKHPSGILVPGKAPEHDCARDGHGLRVKCYVHPGFEICATCRKHTGPATAPFYPSFGVTCAEGKR